MKNHATIAGCCLLLGKYKEIGSKVIVTLHDYYVQDRLITGTKTIERTGTANSSGSTMTLDYDPIGGEPCDKVAQVTINGVSRTITLR